MTDKSKSQWYETDKYDKDTSLQQWSDDGTANTPNYNNAYDGMMKDVEKGKEKKGGK